MIKSESLNSMNFDEPEGRPIPIKLIGINPISQSIMDEELAEGVSFLPSPFTFPKKKKGAERSPHWYVLPFLSLVEVALSLSKAQIGECVRQAAEVGPNAHERDH